MKVKTHGLASEPSTSGSTSKHGQLWQEHIPTACARVEALRLVKIICKLERKMFKMFFFSDLII